MIVRCAYPPPPTARPPGSLQIKGIKDALIATGAIDKAVDAQNFADTRFHHAAITCQTLGANKIALNSIIISTDFSKYYYSRSLKEKESLNEIVATCQRFEFWDELKWVTDLLNNIKMGMEIVVSMGTPMSAYYPIVVAMEAGHARCLMRKPSAVFDSSTAEAIKEHGAIRFNLDVKASRGSTRKVPMSVPSLHCPIPQLSTTQKQRCVCACAICVHLSRLDMYQVWCYMLDPYMRAFDLTLEQSANLREQLVLWSSPDASTRRKLRAELNQFLTGTGDFGVALSSINRKYLRQLRTPPWYFTTTGIRTANPLTRRSRSSWGSMKTMATAVAASLCMRAVPFAPPLPSLPVTNETPHKHGTTHRPYCGCSRLVGD